MTTPMPRRALLAGLLAAAAGPALAKLPTGYPNRRALTPTAYPFTRNRYALAQDFVIPQAATVTQVPLNLVRYEEGAWATLQPDGMVRIEQQGLYRVLLGLDWKAQEQRDVDTRMYGIRRKPAGDVTAPNLQDERLASFDHPGSDSPAAARFTGTWAPGTLPAGGRAYVDVQVSPNVGAIVPGDVASASFSSVLEMGLEATLDLDVQAKVVATDTVRVVLRNQGAAALTLPAGTLRVLAQSTTKFRGESEDAWNVLVTGLEELFPGDRLYVAAKNQGFAGDYIQASKRSTFLQLERYA